MIDKCSKPAAASKVTEERVGPVSAPGSKLSGILDHRAEKRSWKCLDDGFAVQGYAVTRFLEVNKRKNVRGACVRMLV